LQQSHIALRINAACNPSARRTVWRSASWPSKPPKAC
jgi:hypothetical protein